MPARVAESVMSSNPSSGSDAFFNAKKYFLDKYDEANELVEARSDRLDRTLLSLSSGALALSVTLVTRANSPKSYLCILILSWIAFSVSLVAVVLALKQAQTAANEVLKGMGQKLKDLDDRRQDIISGKMTVDIAAEMRTYGRIAMTNQVALWSFVAGIVLMGIFAALNLATPK
jgi:hypothetical protein